MTPATAHTWGTTLAIMYDWNYFDDTGATLEWLVDTYSQFESWTTDQSMATTNYRIHLFICNLF